MIEKANNENSNFKNHPFLKKNKNQFQATSIFLGVLYQHLGFIYSTGVRIVSLPDANLTMDVKTYGQILENTHNCTVSSGPMPYVR